MVANAYVGPLVRSYLTDLERDTAAAGLQPEILLMQSNGGLYDLAAAKEQCVFGGKGQRLVNAILSPNPGRP